MGNCDVENQQQRKRGNYQNRNRKVKRQSRKKERKKERKNIKIVWHL